MFSDLQLGQIQSGVLQLQTNQKQNSQLSDPTYAFISTSYFLKTLVSTHHHLLLPPPRNGFSTVFKTPFFITSHCATKFNPLIMSQQPPPIPNNLHKKPPTLPDFILTALSLFLLVSSSKPSTTTTLLHKFPPPPPLSLQVNPRRFLRIPTMSRRNSDPKNHPFATPQSLSDWLRPRLPYDSFASWGIKPGTKNVHNLWLEVSEGETSLEDSIPPIRTVEVVIVRVIGKDGSLLVESHQELSNGTVRKRGRPLSEKMKPGETVEAAVDRAVKEELGSVLGVSDVGYGGSDGIVRIVPNSYTKRVEERFSISYPGLPACYVLHSVEVVVDGLPDCEFCTEEGPEYENSDENCVADAAVSCRKHFWKWVDSDSV